MSRFVFLLSALLGSALLLAAARHLAPSAETATMAVPQYDARGALLRPRNFEQWTFVGANIGMSYSQGASSGPGEFHNIYMQREAFEAYKQTGKFPEKTMFLLVAHQPAQKVSINKSGYFEGPMSGLAASVKDHEHFQEGWAYFDFGDGGKLQESAEAMPKPMCYDCHSKHADDDNVFVQFHAVLRSLKENSSHPVAK